MTWDSITVGADPEVFLIRNGALLPSIGLIGGTKQEPRKINKNLSVQEDNVMLEFNITPATSAGQFNHRIQQALKIIKSSIVGPIGAELFIQPSAVFNMEDLGSAQARAFGCEPDMNVWAGMPNPTISPEMLPHMALRVAGGHVHVGFSNPDLPQVFENVVKLMDVFLGIPSIVLDDNEDRRSVYGKAGAYRQKPYGIEYRTLSNFWLRHPAFTKWVFNQTQKAARGYQLFEKRFGDVAEDIQSIINNSKVDDAWNFINDYNITMPAHVTETQPILV